MKTEIRFYIIREVSNNYNKEDKDLATIKDIANRLGVSVSTVSKGLNGASDISDELRQMVLDTAVEMGYATKRSKKVEKCTIIQLMAISIYCPIFIIILLRFE